MIFIDGELGEIEERVLIVLERFVRLDALGAPAPVLHDGRWRYFGVDDFYKAIEEEFEIEIPDFDRQDISTGQALAAYLYARKHCN
ncbi:hypothetical protein ACLEJQ_01465 [Pseudomonas sp. SMV71]|uniref:hypothetical protein n=1 Tax=Pseudomonas sp. SMV71 TaxID=3390195 RepID=UPI003F85308F